MNKAFIKNYVEKLTKGDIYGYCNKENIKISDEEVELLYKILKNDIDNLLNYDFISYVNNYKSYFTEEVFNLIIEKYEKYKHFIN